MNSCWTLRVCAVMGKRIFGEGAQVDLSLDEVLEALKLLSGNWQSEVICLSASKHVGQTFSGSLLA